MMSSSSSASGWGISVGVGVGVACLLWALVDRWIRAQRGRQGPISWPLLGSTVEVLRNYEHFNDWQVPYLEKYGMTFLFNTADLSYVFTADPANVEHILKNNFANYPKGDTFHNAFEIFLGDGIFNTDGEIWRKQRKSASHEFSSNVLRDYSAVVFQEHALKLASMLNHSATVQQSVDMQDLFMRLTLDTVCKISFGVNIGALNPELPDIPFARAFQTTNEICSSRFMDPFWKFKRALKIGTEATVAKSAQVVDDFIYDVIKTRKAEMVAMRSSVKGETLGQVRKDIFTRFLLLNEEGGQQFTDKEFRDFTTNFVVAGRDTVAVGLSWFMFMVTSHAEVAQKIYEELCAFENASNDINTSNNAEQEQRDGKGKEGNFDQELHNFSQLLNYDSLMKLHYLHASILETLRLYPGVPMDPKSVLADDILPSGMEVKKGSFVMYTAWGMGRMTEIWGPDATEFKPERWLSNGVVQQVSPFKFTAFQAGPRICLGKDSALLQLRMTTAMLCRFFTFKLVKGCDVRYRQMSTCHMANGLSVDVTRR